MILPATLFFLLIWRYSMKTLRRNDRGNDVKKWQLFLIGQRHLTGGVLGLTGGQGAVGMNYNFVLF